ncbi:MAG TPA: phosphotransferase, partial [Acidimicrobiales bacterium]|nr:phosphotransferase [Acidimicrobiales bacterium]
MHRPVLEAASPLIAAVARLVFGTDDLVRVSDALSEWTRAELGASIDVVEQWHWSVGAVALVRLDDGRPVALKAFPPRWTEPFLGAVVAVQRHLADRGLPCPRPLAGPLPLPLSGAEVCAEADD